MFLLFLLPVLASAVSVDQHIVGGNNVNIGSYPWQGSYRTAQDSHTCGCIYVGSNWVLTAGHCGGGGAYSAGFDNSNRHEVTAYGISRVSRHPNYNQGAGFTPNDFAVVELNEVPSGSNVSPGTISRDPSNPGGNGSITGWGRTCGTCALPNDLQGTNIRIISDSECTERWGDSFNAANMVCVYNGNSGSCNGDSGGPLSKQSTIHGVTSWGVSGCDPAYPSVYAKVGAESDWICGATNNEGSGC